MTFVPQSAFEPPEGAVDMKLAVTVASAVPMVKLVLALLALATVAPVPSTVQPLKT